MFFLLNHYYGLTAWTWGWNNSSCSYNAGGRKKAMPYKSFPRDWENLGHPAAGTAAFSLLGSSNKLEQFLVPLELERRDRARAACKKVDRYRLNRSRPSSPSRLSFPAAKHGNCFSKTSVHSVLFMFLPSSKKCHRSATGATRRSAQVGFALPSKIPSSQSLTSGRVRSFERLPSMTALSAGRASLSVPSDLAAYL